LNFVTIVHHLLFQILSPDISIVSIQEKNEKEQNLSSFFPVKCYFPFKCTFGKRTIHQQQQQQQHHQQQPYQIYRMHSLELN
jgi:hypothetical protein